MSNASDFIIENGVLKKYIGPGGEVVVPENITEIGASAFWGCEEVNVIHLPESITSVGDGAFYACSKLKTINLPDRIERIEESSFWRCKKLQGLMLPSKLKYIGFQAFYQCTGLKSITIPESTEIIEKDAFRKCSKLEKTVILGTPKLDKDSFRQSDTVLITCKLPITKISGLHLKHKAVFGWIENNQEEFPVLDTVSAGIKKYMGSIFDTIVEDARANKQLIFKLLDKRVLNIDQIDALLSCFSDDPEVVASLLSNKNLMYTPEDVEKNEEKKQEKALRKQTVAELKKLWAIKELEDGSLMLVTYKGTEKRVVVPNMIGKKPVIKIGAECFGEAWYYGNGFSEIPNRVERKEIEEIEICEGITRIEYHAFYKCESLATVIIPKSVNYICPSESDWRGETTSPFEGCPNVTIHAPAGSYAETYAKENNIPFVAE